MRWFVKFTHLILLSILAFNVTALDINLSRYKVYEADLNGDGKLDYYFQGKQLIVPIHGDIITPIVLPAPASLTIYSYGNQYFVPVEESYTEAELLIRFLQPSSASSSSLQTIIAGATVPRFDFNSQAPAEFTYSLAASGVPDLGASQLVASTQGKLSVTNGAANYSIDIDLPPAVRDLKPKLSLTYNSRSGNGLMGVGWGLSGLSSITRCNASFATEGAEAQKSNPRYTISDRLCLDGQKLVLADNTTSPTNANYWATGVNYKTEIDNFSKIVAYGSSASGGHGYFKVWTKDKRILTFGEADTSQNSKLYSSSLTTSPVTSWLLDKVEDAYGNSYTVSYSNDLANGDYYPKQINFAPDSAVVFTYQEREGQIPWGYSKGNYFKRTKVLDTVTTYVNVTAPAIPENGTPVKRYDVNYTLSPITQRELADTITECGYQSSSWKCAKPLELDWQEGESGFDVANPFTLQYCTGGSITDAVQVVDLDGDDRNDVIRRNGKIAWGSASSCFDNGDWVTSGYTLEASSPLMTLNGYALLVQWTDTTVTPNKKVVGLINNINRTNSTKTYTEIDRDSTDVGSFMISDLNNDGLDDFYYKGIKFTQAYQSTTAFVQTGVRIISKSAGTSLMDVFGDGLKSRITTDVNYSTTNGLPIGVFVVFPSGASFEANTTKLYTVAEPFKDSPIQQPGGMYRTVADINGDGNKDFLYHQVTGNTGYWFYRINKQNGTVGTQVATGIVAAKSGQSYQVYNHYSYAYDYDQDGREDLLAIVPEGANVCKLRVLLARDTGGDSVSFVEATDASGNLITYSANLGACTPVYNETQSHILIGDFNNDGSLDISHSGTIYPGKQKQPDLLIGVTDGFGAETKIGYSTLVSGSSFYMAGTKPVFPQTTAGRNVQVVSHTETSNGIGGYNSSYYYYSGAKSNRQGRGFVGFETISIINPARNIVTHTEYQQSWPYIGKVKKQTVKTSNGELVSVTSNTYDVHANNARFPYLKSVLQKNYGLTTTLEGSPIGVSKTNNVFDACGNITEKTVKIGASISGTTITGEVSNQLVTNTYDYNATQDCTDDFLEQSTQEVSKDNGADSKTSITEFTPNTQQDIDSRIDFKGSVVQKTTTFDRGTNGVVTAVTETAKDFDNTDEPDRITAYSDFLKGLYPQTIVNAENHSTSLTYDLRFGAVLTETVLGQTTTNTYDALGRLKSQLTPDNTLTENVAFYCNSSSPVTCPTGAKYGVALRVTNNNITEILGAPLSITFYDSLQREIRSVVYSLDGNVINKVTQYTAEGYLYRVSEPYVTSEILAGSSGATAWTTYSNYDALGRPGTITGPDGGSKTTTYTTDSYGLKISSAVLVNKPGVSAETQTTNQWLNAVGDVVRVEDALSGIVTYGYDALGNLETTQLGTNLATKIEITHDVAGNKTYINDPDAGKINFDFNGFGDLRRQTWQKNVSGVEKYITYDYDKLGRQISRVDQPASGSSISYSWVWDTKQQGQLSYRSGNGFQEEYFYDGFSRLSRQIVTTSGLSGGEFIYTYDNFSRPETIRYPNGYKIQRDYHAAGYQVQTRDITSSPRVLWAMGSSLDARGNFNNQLWGNGVVTQTAFDSASGQLTGIKSGRLSSTNNFSSLFGDVQNLSYSYDSLGNLASRTTARTNANGVALENITESYAYDKLNRLKTVTTSGLFARTQTFDYDLGGLGNLINRSDVLSGSSINNDVGQLNYDQVRNAGVHAVTSAGGVNYSYDKYGNMIARGSETIVYDTFNKPTRITGASITDFYYDPDHELYKEIRGTKVVYKLAGGTYEVIVDGATTTQKSYVDGVILNTRTLVNGIQNANDTAYLHSDHLGSVEATTNALGQFVNRMSFGAWGERQKSDWKPGVPAESFLTSSGFTGHNQLDAHNLIHMGGRVYDPNLGRFLSADLFVQSPYNSQSFNRYSYTFNNPGSFTDPTGYMCTTEYFHHYYRNESGGTSYWGDTSQQSCDGNDFYNKPGYDNGYENIQLPLLSNSINFGMQNSTGIIAPLEGNSFYGAAAVIVEEISLGIIWGENGTILALRSSPQIEANKTAALNGLAGPALRGLQVAMIIAGPGKVAKGAESGAWVLVGANRAKIDPRKLIEYALNPNHPSGVNKAKVFESALGFNQSNAGGLLQQLLRGVMTNTPTAGKVDNFGARFTVDIPVRGPSGNGVVRTGWIYRVGSDIPELTTLFVR